MSSNGWVTKVTSKVFATAELCPLHQYYDTIQNKPQNIEQIKMEQPTTQ